MGAAVSKSRGAITRLGPAAIFFFWRRVLRRSSPGKQKSVAPDPLRGRQARENTSQVVPLGDPSPLPKMSDVDISKLKVVELKAELQARGLDTKGNKAVLVKRLKDAMDAGPTGEGPGKP